MRLSVSFTVLVSLGMYYIKADDGESMQPARRLGESSYDKTFHRYRKEMNKTNPTLNTTDLVNHYLRNKLNPSPYKHDRPMDGNLDSSKTREMLKRFNFNTLHNRSVNFNLNPSNGMKIPEKNKIKQQTKSYGKIIAGIILLFVSLGSLYRKCKRKKNRQIVASSPEETEHAQFPTAIPLPYAPLNSCPPNQMSQQVTTTT